MENVYIFQSTSNVRTQNMKYYSNSLPLPQPAAEERKFAEKPNALKKVALDDIDDIQTNSISDSGFSWSNMLSKCRFHNHYVSCGNLITQIVDTRINLQL